MIPAFDSDGGRLPPGEHIAVWDEIVDRFGWTERRRRLLDGLAEALELLGAAGRRRVWVNGSFVTAKDEPDDFDACWDTDGVDLDALDPILLDLSDGRRAQKDRFGGELFPNVTESQSGLSFSDFFQNERDTARASSSSTSRKESDHDHQRSAVPGDQGPPRTLRTGSREH